MSVGILLELLLNLLDEVLDLFVELRDSSLDLLSKLLFLLCEGDLDLINVDGEVLSQLSEVLSELWGVLLPLGSKGSISLVLQVLVDLGTVGEVAHDQLGLAGVPIGDDADISVPLLIGSLLVGVIDSLIGWGLGLSPLNQL